MTSSDNEVISKFQTMGLNDRTDFLDKSVVWINDSNSGSFNGQIIFDLASLGSSNRWLSLSESYLEIPYVVSMKASIDMTTIIKPTTLAIKDGFHQIIDSISVECGQKTVCQVQNFTNIHTQFKMLTSSSQEDLTKNSATTGFTTDRVDEYTYSATAVPDGIGYINNADGIYETRQYKTIKDDIDLDYFPANKTFVPNTYIQNGGSYYRKSGDDASRIYYWVFMCTIKLGHITDFFDKIPLSHLSDVRLNVTYNASAMVVDMTRTGDPGANPPVPYSYNMSLDSYQQLSGHCCPYIVTGLGSSVVKVTVTSGVIKTSQITPTVSAITSCRLYVPLYKIADNISLSMIQVPTKFNYNDIYSYTIPEITTSNSFTYTLTTGIVDPQYLVVIPYPKTSVVAGAATYQSPFDSAPGTSSNIILDEFNVQIGGVSLFQENIRYDFQMFNNELSKINAINGNNVLGLTSGVIDLNMFRRGYRMYVADLRRRPMSDDNVVKSVVISGRNTSLESIELICFIAYKKSFSIDTATGIVKD